MRFFIITLSSDIIVFVLWSLIWLWLVILVDRLWYEIFAGIADAGSSLIRGCLLGQSRHRPHSPLAGRGTAIVTDPPLVSHLPYYKIIGGLWKNYNLVNIYLHFESFKFDFIIFIYFIIFLFYYIIIYIYYLYEK